MLLGRRVAPAASGSGRATIVGAVESLVGCVTVVQRNMLRLRRPIKMHSFCARRAGDWPTVASIRDMSRRPTVNQRRRLSRHDSCSEVGGDAGNRTRIHGFAERCLRPHHRSSEHTREAPGTGLRGERGASQRVVTANDSQRRPLPHSARPRISTHRERARTPARRAVLSDAVRSATTDVADRARMALLAETL